MTDVTGGAASNASPSRRDLEDLGTEPTLNGISSGDDIGMPDDDREARSFAGYAGGDGDAASLGGHAGRSGLMDDGKAVASAKAQKAKQWAGEVSSRQAEAFRRRVLEKPVETSVAVFGVGLIAGLLLRR